MRTGSSMTPSEDRNDRLVRLYLALREAYMIGDTAKMDDLRRQIEEALGDDD